MIGVKPLFSGQSLGEGDLATFDVAMVSTDGAMLERKGLRCWMAPRDITAGMNWGEAIIDAIGEADAMVLLLTAASNAYLAANSTLGRALAGGCGLATACDVVLAADTAEFGYPEVRIGFVPAMVMAILRRNVSEKRAFELIVAGQPIAAAEAERIGLINHAWPDTDFDRQRDLFVADLAARSPSAVQLSKRLLYHADGMGFEAALRSGADVNVVARMTEDMKAGVARFLERA